MNKGAALAVVEDEMQDSEDELNLTELQRTFALEFFRGEFAGNATKTFMKVTGDVNYNTSSANASVLLKHRKVKKFLQRLHAAAMAQAVKEKMVPWTELIPLAQGVIVATAQGKLRNRLAYEAACHLIDRALGKPKETHQVEVMNESKVNTALKALRTRISIEGTLVES